MSISQLVPIKVTLAPGATPLPSFGVSLILGELTTAQYADFIVQSGGSSVLAIQADGLTDTLSGLGLNPGERVYEDAVSHFRGERVPELAYIGYRGVADRFHKQSVQILPDAGSLDRASVGKYSLTDIEGGPYTYTSPGAAQVVTLTVTDAGGGDGAPGTYMVQDESGKVFSYASAGFNVWTLTITVATTGLYTLVVGGVTYSYTAGAGDSIEDIRDGLFADTINFVAHAPHPSWTGNKVSTDAITVTGNSIGETLVVTSNLGPGAIEATVVETTPIVPETTAVIAAGIEAAITGAAVPPPNYTPVAALAVVTITANPGFEGTDLGIIGNGPAAGDLVLAVATDFRELVSAVRDALDTAITAATHPSFTNATVSTDILTITGTVAGQAVSLSVSAVEGHILLVEDDGVLTLRTAQVSRISIITNPADSFAFPGTYELTAFGVMVSYVAASSETPTSVRDAIQALVDANIPEVTTSLAGVQAFDMTGNTLGAPFGVTLSSPNSDAAMTQTLTTASQGIRNDILRAIQDNTDWYILLNSGSQVDIEVATDTMDDIGADTPRMHFWQSGDAEMKDTPIADATDVGATTFATGTRRSKGVWNPEPVTPDAGANAYEGVASQWVGSYTTLLPGQVQPTGKRQQVFTSRNRLPVQQESNLEARAVQYMEFVPSLGAAGGQVMQRRFTPAGRLIDLQRALDQILVVYQTLALDFITGQPIVKYTNSGIGEVNNAVVVAGTNLLREQGLVVSTEAEYVNGRLPRISDASQADRDAGILPVFAFNIVIQLGATEIPIEVNVSQ